MASELNPTFAHFVSCLSAVNQTLEASRGHVYTVLDVSAVEMLVCRFSICTEILFSDVYVYPTPLSPCETFKYNNGDMYYSYLIILYLQAHTAVPLETSYLADGEYVV